MSTYILYSIITLSEQSIICYMVKYILSGGELKYFNFASKLYIRCGFNVSGLLFVMLVTYSCLKNCMNLVDLFQYVTKCKSIFCMFFKFELTHLHFNKHFSFTWVFLTCIYVNYLYFLKVIVNTYSQLCSGFNFSIRKSKG